MDLPIQLCGVSQRWGQWPCLVDAKLDGVRAVVRNGEATLRGGFTLPLELGLPKGWVIDGELCAETWNATISALNTGTYARLRLYAFDALTEGEWDSQWCELGVQERRERLEALAHGRGLELVPYTYARSERDMRSALRRYVDGGHEGVVLKRLDAPYGFGRRGCGWAKVKPTLSCECVLIGGSVALGIAVRTPLGGEQLVRHIGKGVWDELARLASGPDSLKGTVLEVEHKGYELHGTLKAPVVRRVRHDLQPL